MKLRSFLRSVKNSVVTYLNLKFQLFGTPRIGEVKFEGTTIFPSYQKEIQTRATFDKELHWKFKMQKEILFPETFVTVLKDGRVWGDEGFVITRENILFDKVSRHYDKECEDLSIFKQRKIVKPNYKDAVVAVLAASGSNIYYHWMIDIVPRVNLLVKSGVFDSIDYFVINHKNLGFQKELLNKLSIDDSKIILSYDWNFHLQAKELVVPSLVSPNDAPSLETCLFLRNLFKAEINNEKAERRIYIQRKKGRKIVNEHTLIEQLCKKGFEIIEPENLTVSQQACLFSQARFIIAPHGAGLTNIVFCKPGTRIIDIFSPEWVNPCYWILSSQLNLNYSYILGEGEKIPDFYDPVGKNTDIIVDPAKFSSLLEEIERNSV